MTKSSVLIQAIALIICTSALVTPAKAHLLDGLGLDRGSLGLPDIQQCLTSILGAPGCLNELILSAVSLQPQLLGPVCCEAFLKIDENCWPKIFLWNSGFPPLLKNYCTGKQDSPPSPPSNTPPAPSTPITPPCNTPPPPPPPPTPITPPCETPPPPPPLPCPDVDGNTDSSDGGDDDDDDGGGDKYMLY